MKRKRIPYNELSEDIYGSKYWSKSRLIILGFSLLFIGFLINFSLEDKINKILINTLSHNEACPIAFDHAELSYFFPKLELKKSAILSECFGQSGHQLAFSEASIAFGGPSFYPPGIKLNISLKSGKTNLLISYALSPFFQYIDLQDSKIDAQIFKILSSDNKSLVEGLFNIQGQFKTSSGLITEGFLNVVSKDFRLPAQNISGYELSQMNLNRFILKAHFTNKETLKIDQFEIGQLTAPLSLTLKGNIYIDPNQFAYSKLSLNGALKLASNLPPSLSVIKVLLPSENTSGNYRLKLTGTFKSIVPKFE